MNDGWSYIWQGISGALFIILVGFILFGIIPSLETQPQPVEYIFIEYTVDICEADNIGLKKLTINDIEELVK